jgi:hypothetical protein
MFITMYDVMSGDWNGCGCGFGSYRTPTQLPVIFITNSRRFSLRTPAKSEIKVPLFITIFRTTLITNTMYFLNFRHYGHPVFFYRSGDRNGHLLRESVIKKPCEMSLSPLSAVLYRCQSLHSHEHIKSF